MKNPVPSIGPALNSHQHEQWKRERKASKKVVAGTVVERVIEPFTHTPFDKLAHKLTGDGCDECNPGLAKELSSG